MGLVVYTAVFGPQAKPLATPRWSDPTVPMLCFTDRPLIADPWQIIQLPPEPDPARGNRRLKLLSHHTVTSDWSLYMDSNFRLMADPRPLLGLGDFVTHRHPFCSNIIQEAAEIVRCKKADPQLVRQQVAEYQARGFCTPDNPQRNHSANGVILRRHTPKVMDLNEAWWREVAKHSHRDQLSLDFCAWQADFQIHYWPGALYNNPYFMYGRGRRV